ncbi:hypothetical protein D187_002160 [Cystobacter fuscus DSM 2262]|uniref:Uncharacterized protein n=1 Tax=Cystobacter fuscus (strain ATCC 25194 / DSM 2262 / NBRC 100088 / M29) TaxID=1242864 RepID=S9QFI1_CYSF2|nr:hypothetical protein D187_002160 [Cystobacter fuscus DSM 2262]
MHPGEYLQGRQVQPAPDQPERQTVPDSPQDFHRRPGCAPDDVLATILLP